MVSTWWINGQLHETQLYYRVKADEKLPAGSEVFFYAKSEGDETEVVFATPSEGDCLFVEGEAKAAIVEDLEPAS